MKPIYSYDEAMALHILTRLQEGKSLRSICKGPGMPSAPSVRAWVLADPVFAERYARARAEGLELMAEEIVEIADDSGQDRLVLSDEPLCDGDVPDVIYGNVIPENIQRSKLRVDTRKWILSKLVPKIYGDKQVIEHQGEIKLTERLLRARSR